MSRKKKSKQQPTPAPPPAGSRKEAKFNKKATFSMMESARNTEKGSYGKFPTQRLEKRTMAFVSAGSTFDQSIEEASHHNPIHSSTVTSETPAVPTPAVSTPAVPTPAVSRPSSPDSTSSAEIILFSGRNKPSRSSTPALRQNNLVKSTSQLQLKDEVNTKPLAITTSALPHRTFSSSRPLALSDSEVDDEMLADYIANMDSSDSEDEFQEGPPPYEELPKDKGKQPAKLKNNDKLFKTITKQVSEAQIINSQATRSEQSFEPYKIHETYSTRKPAGESSKSTNGWNPVNAPKAKKVHSNRAITSILSQRQGNAAVYYLVVYENQDDDTAEWVESDQLQNMTTSALQFFESPMWETEDTESIDSEVQAEKDLAAMFNDEMIQEAQLRKKQNRMTDEEIAIRLAKQESLGIDASEVVLFDGDEESGESIEYLRQEAVRYSIRSGKGLPRMDSDSDFDLMDYERPSLQKTKGRKKKPKFGVLDSDMERDMLATWEIDRSKKKMRKKEREELRAQGLLGGGAKAKYAQGMSMEDLKEEFRKFLQSERSTLTLPPMDKTERKLVHEIAHNFSITSTSRGNGANRHPTLVKKARTRPWSEAVFDGTSHRMMKRFKPGKFKDTQGSKKRFTYKEGELVGSNAAELGSDNRGRAMLERMGWAKGDALGAIGNPGILDPISHVVKSGRSGLG